MSRDIRISDGKATHRQLSQRVAPNKQGYSKKAAGANDTAEATEAAAATEAIELSEATRATAPR